MRKPKSVFVSVEGERREYEILRVCGFNSTRKRMSTVVRGPDRRGFIFNAGSRVSLVCNPVAAGCRVLYPGRF